MLIVRRGFEIPQNFSHNQKRLLVSSLLLVPRKDFVVLTYARVSLSDNNAQ